MRPLRCAVWASLAAALVVVVMRLRDPWPMAIEDARADRRFGAALAAGERGAAGAPAFGLLVELLAVPQVAADAAWALGEIGPAAKPALPALIAAIDAGDQVRCARIAWALGRIAPGDLDVEAALTRIEQGGEPLARMFAKAARMPR